MNHYPQSLRERRKQLGMTQSHLAFQSGLSLPTIQNIEGGRGNPCWDVLEKITETLGLQIKFETVSANWAFLSEAGLPLEETFRKSNTLISPSILIRELVLAAEEVLRTPDSDSRKGECLQAFLFALKGHYPTFYKERVTNPVLAHFAVRPINGRIIKLGRIALARISHYL